MSDSLGSGPASEDQSIVTLDRDASAPASAADLTRRNLITRAGAAGAVLSLSGLLAACGSSETTTGSSAATEGPQTSGTDVDHIAVGYGAAAPTGLDIVTAWDISQMAASMLGMEGLVASDDRLRWRPALAKSWTQPDPLRYVFDLRPGVKFWDGTPLTIDDVIFSLERMRGPSSLITSYYANVKSIVATGKAQVTITLAKPDPTIPGVLVFSPISSKAFVTKLGKKFGAPGSTATVLGTGPYKITSYTVENGLQVERNEDYWGERPKVKSATMTFFEDPQTSRLAAQGGEIDGVIEFPLSLAKDWDGTNGFATEYPPGLNVAFISMNVEKEPWNDIHVRRAVAHCTDTAGYVKAFLSEKGVPATALVPPAQWSNVASEGEVASLYRSLEQYPYDIEAAKEELAKSKYPNGFTDEVIFSPDAPQIGSALESLSQALAEIGINLKVTQVSHNTYLNKFLENKDLGIFCGQAYPDYADPSDYLLVFLLSENAVEGKFNLAHFKNKEVDKLLEEQAAATDKGQRRELLGKALEIVADELPYLPLWWQSTPSAINERYVDDGFNALFFNQPWLANIGAAA
jgi:peptide/nickel transport system substrate-binding protein